MLSWVLRLCSEVTSVLLGHLPSVPKQITGISCSLHAFTLDLKPLLVLAKVSVGHTRFTLRRGLDHKLHLSGQADMGRKTKFSV